MAEDLTNNPLGQDDISKSMKDIQSMYDEANDLVFQLSGGEAGQPLHPAKNFEPSTGGFDFNQFKTLDDVYSSGIPEENIMKNGYSIESMINGLNNTFAQLPSVANNELKFADKAVFGTNRHHYNIERYKNMDNLFYNEFTKLGFDPYRDNEDYYNKHASSLNDLYRSAVIGYMGNVSVGWDNWWNDSWINPFADNPEYTARQSADEFAQNIANTQSTRSGVAPFLGNTMSQLGLSIGMMGGFIAETGLVTLATAGLGTEASIAKGATQIPKFANLAGKAKQLNNFWNTIKTADGLRKVYEIGKGVGKGAQAIAKNAVPNTIRGWKNIDSIETLASASSAFKGFGNFYKDVSIARMAVGESKIEAGLVYKEEESKLLHQFRQRKGREPNLDEWGKIQSTADEAARSTFLWNFPLVYGTNLITFNRMFTGFGKKTFANFDRQFLKNGAGQVLINKEGAKTVLKDTAKKGAKDRLKNAWSDIKTPRAWGQRGFKLGKGFLKYSKANFSEGVQEYFQEVIADTAQDYYTDIYWGGEGNADVGDWYYHLAANTKKYMSAEGGEIFLSGFLMGGMMGPLQTAVAKVGAKASEKGLFTGGRVGYNKDVRESNRKKYQEYKKKEEEELERIAKTYNEVTQNLTKYYHPGLENYVTQKNLQREMAEAKATGDEQLFNTSKDKADFYNVKALIETGKYDHILDVIKDYKNLSVEEFNEAANLTGSEAVKTKDEQIALVDKMLGRAKDIRDRYQKIAEKYPNKYNPNKFVEGSIPYNQEAARKIAHDDFIAQASLADHLFERALERRISLYNKLTTKSFWRSKSIADKTSASDFEKIIDIDLLNQETRILSDEIDELRERQKIGGEVFRAEDKKRLKEKESLFDNWKEYEDSLKAYKDAVKNKEYQYDSKINEIGKYSPEQIQAQREAAIDLEVAFINLIEDLAKRNNANVKRDELKNALEAIKDYHNLEDDVDYYSDIINYLANQEVREEFVIREAMHRYNMHENRMPEIRKHLNAQKIRKENGVILDDLEKAGYFIKNDGIVQLFDKAEVPTNFYFVKSKKEYYLGDKVPEGTPEFEEATAIVEDWLVYVRTSEGTASEIDEALKEERIQKGEKETEEEKPAAEKPQPSPKVTTKDEEEEEEIVPTGTGTSITAQKQKGKVSIDTPFEQWPVDLQAEANKSFKEVQARRVRTKQPEFNNIQEWIDTKSQPVKALLAKYNKEESVQDKFNKLYRALEGSPSIKQIDEFINYVSKLKDSDGIPSDVKEESLKFAEELKIAEKKKIEAKKSKEEPTPEPGAVYQPSGATVRPYWEPNKKGQTVPQIVQQVLDKMESNQEGVKRFRELTKEEAEAGQFDRTAHGYVIKNKEGEWVKAKSVTQTTKSSFDIEVGRLVEIIDSGEIGFVKTDPDTNPEYKKDSAEEDLFDIELESTGEIIKGVRGAEIKDITFTDSTVGGTFIDSLVREFFDKGSLPEEVPEGINPIAYQALVKGLESAKKEFGDLKVVAKDIILYDIDPIAGHPIAGEIDLLLYNENTGEFFIYDMKTSMTPFWVKTGIGGSKLELNPAFTQPRQKSPRRGENRSKKEGYEMQQSIYKNLFEKQYGVKLGSKLNSGTFLLPFTIKFKKDRRKGKEFNTYVESLTKEDTIPLHYNVSIQKYVEPVDAKPINEAVAGPSDQFIKTGLKDVDAGDIKLPVIELGFSKEEAAAINNNAKFTSLQDINTLKAKVRNLETAPGINPIAYVKVNGERYSIVSLGHLTRTAAAAQIVNIANQKENLDLATEILGVDFENLTAEEKDMKRIALSESLSTTDPGDAYAIQIGDETYYTNKEEIKNLIEGKGKEILLTFVYDPEVSQADLAFDKSETKKALAMQIKNATVKELNILEKDGQTRGSLEYTLNNLNDDGTLFQELYPLIVERRQELEKESLYNKVKHNEIYEVNSDHISTFGKYVMVQQIPTDRKYIGVKDASKSDAQLQFLGKKKFEQVIKEKVEEIEQEPEVIVTPEEKTTVKENVENSKTLSVEERNTAIENNKDSSSDDILERIKEKIEKNCE